MSDLASTCLTKKEHYWLEHIQQIQASSQSLTEYAQAYTLNLKGLYHYRPKLSNKVFLEPRSMKSFVKASVLGNTIIIFPSIE